MRFEVLTAFLLGLAIPVLETVRRGLGFEDVTTLVEDYVVGALLLLAAGAVRAGRRPGPLLLVVAWAALAGGLFPSFFGHLEDLLRGKRAGPREAWIVAVKGVIYAVCLVSLVRSARALTGAPAPAQP